MQRASKRQKGPCQVMGFELNHSIARLIKISDFHWVVVFEDARDPLAFKVVDCISFEHAGEIFDGCVQSLKEWMN